ncbi:cation transport protein ChaC [Loktanella ponticola]|uniref:glutathione-specific gamma-glutamylcyclotransferase n=1 Tax=Yoonia ponticola TaxID=1524255 RepID=A0A7W9F0P9_9RHOB|nr:gamma-glutamylcyclotransferase [Yoonia ponticola]MBB5723146.1 cation transport protein ChaC [Yoonia ponticola]
MAFWVFGYGSLLWNPGFEPVEKVRATLPGYHRSFCMLSIHHRGTDEDPGLVLALDEANATCTGLALKVHEDQAETVLAYLRERELVSSAYLEKHVTLQADDGREITALAYVINPGHVQYCQFDLEKQAQMIAAAVGGRGPNTEYLFNTAQLLAELHIPDPDMDWLVARVQQIKAAA